MLETKDDPGSWPYDIYLNGDQFNDWVDFIISEYNGEHLDSTSPTHLGKITSRIRDTLRTHHVKNVHFSES